jgi:RimJ/RimL family protein N-acetyltransferase
METLFGKYVRLEPLSARHLDDLEKHFLPEHTRHYPKFFDSAHEYYEQLIEKKIFGRVELFATVAQSDEKAVGCTGFLNIDEGNRRLEIGATWLGRSVQGGPLNAESKLLLFTEAFERRHCARVELKMDARNTRSAAAVLALGATREGLLRKHMLLPDGHFRDTVYFSLLDTEWPEAKKNLEARVSRKAGV